MDSRSKLALYPAYYLARFNQLAYEKLAFGNQRETHEAISNIIGVKQTTFKQMRDGYDPIFTNRAGYYQRPLSASRASVSDALENLSESEVHAIVMEILGHKTEDTESIKILLSVPESGEKGKAKRKFVPRGPTGRKAEEYFINWFLQHQKPVSGELIDTRELGTGYDFEIKSATDIFYVEVKGLADADGGIGFTGKEWDVAEYKGHKYFLCVVSNVRADCKIIFIQNPAAKLTPTQQIVNSIQVNWNVTAKQLTKLDGL